jgi:ankyrin repeat protein
LNSTANIVEYEYNSRTPLHAAVVGEHFPQIGLLLAAGADANISDAQQITPLHSAIAQGLDKVVNDLVFIGKSAIDAVTEWGDSILKYAFVSPSSRKLRSLLRFHFEEHAHEAMESVSGNARFVTLFLENGADVTSCDADGNYPMHWIINGTSISYRLDGVDVILSNKSGMFGPDCNYLERAQQLLDNGFVDRVDGCNKFGQTPLHLAFARGMTDVAKLLLDNNANPNIIDDRGNIPLHVACVGWALNSEELVRKMLLIGNAKRLIKGTFTSADVARGLTKKAREDHDIENYVNTSYDSIVVAPPAVISRQIPKEKLILLPNKLGYSAIHYACGAGIAGGGASELVQPLGVALGSCPFEGCEMQKPTDDDEELQKRKAILMNRMAILRCLLENGGDPNTIGKNGMRPLHCVAQSSASWHGDLDEKVAERLIAAGAKLDEVDAQGRAGGGGSRFSPLHYAIQTKQFHLTWFLINRGAAIHAATCNPPLLHLACEYGADLELIGYILSHGEDANMRGHGIYRGHRKYCGTALQLAAANGHENIVFALLSSGGNVDVNAAREHNGRTALHLAAFHGHAGCVKHLLEDGSADSKVCCNNGETPLMSAIRGGSVSCLKVFVEAFGSVCILANGDDAILLAEQLNFQKRTSDVHVGVVEYLLSLLPENKLQGVAHVHECYASRQSIVRFEEAKAAALEAERKSAEMSELRRMVEAIFAKADRAGTGHLNMEALKSLHDEIGAGTNMNEEVYLEISETIGANPDHGWDAEHLFQAYAEGHSFFSLERDHDILFPRQNMEEDPEAQQQLRTESYDESN